MSLDVVLLPNDLVFRILLWLPVMSLLRFKSVCKSWYALIQSSSFSHRHYLHQQQYAEENYTLIIMDPKNANGSSFSRTGRPRLSVLSPHPHPHDANNFQQQLIFDSPDGGEYSSYNLTISICNGIICLHALDSFLFLHEKLKVSLWNPATKQYSLLPHSPFPPPAPYEMLLHVSIGFGLNVETQDYKVVRIFTFPIRRPSHVEIYSLASDSWKTLDTVLPVDCILSDPRTPYQNGTYCWIGKKFDYSKDYGNMGEIVILSFDFSQEVFETMALPDADSVKSDPAPRLSFIRDHIACINWVSNLHLANWVTTENSVQTLINPMDLDDTYFEIWVLQEYGVEESWTKLYKIGPFSSAGQLGLSMTGDFFFFASNHRLCIHELDTQETITLPAQDNLFLIWELQIAAYRESLVSIRRGNGAAN